MNAAAPASARVIEPNRIALDTVATLRQEASQDESGDAVSPGLAADDQPSVRLEHAVRRCVRRARNVYPQDAVTTERGIEGAAGLEADHPDVVVRSSDPPDQDRLDSFVHDVSGFFERPGEPDHHVAVLPVVPVGDAVWRDGQHRRVGVDAGVTGEQVVAVPGDRQRVRDVRAVSDVEGGAPVVAGAEHGVELSVASHLQHAEPRVLPIFGVARRDDRPALERAQIVDLLGTGPDVEADLPVAAEPSIGLAERRQACERRPSPDAVRGVPADDDPAARGERHCVRALLRLAEVHQLDAVVSEGWLPRAVRAQPKHEHPVVCLGGSAHDDDPAVRDDRCIERVIGAAEVVAVVHARTERRVGRAGGIEARDGDVHVSPGGVAGGHDPALTVDADRRRDRAVGERGDDAVASERRIEQRGSSVRGQRAERELHDEERGGEATHRRPRLRPPLAGHGTIFEIGSSRMSLAPAVLSCGIRRFTPRLSTTVSIAKPPSASEDTVGAFIDGTTASTASRCSCVTLSLINTRPSASIAPRSSVTMSSIAARFAGSAAASPFATSTGSDVSSVSMIFMPCARRVEPVSVTSTIASTISGTFASVAPNDQLTFTSILRSANAFFVSSTNSVEMRVPGGISLALFAGCSFGTASTTLVPWPVPVFAYVNVVRTSRSAAVSAIQS